MCIPSESTPFPFKSEMASGIFFPENIYIGYVSLITNKTSILLLLSLEILIGENVSLVFRKRLQEINF